MQEFHNGLSIRINITYHTAMKKSIAYLFPGQGAQYTGMSIDLLSCDAVKILYDTASEIFNRNVKEILESDTDYLMRTDVSQPALTVANLAAAEYLKCRGYTPAVCAGFSLGEYAALVCAGVITTADCFRLVKARGEAMQKTIDRLGEKALPSGLNGDDSASAGMSVITGLAPERVETLFTEIKEAGINNVYIANFNSPKQIVISGTAAALAKAERYLKNAGAERTVRLPAAYPFHSPLMEDALVGFIPVLETITFCDPVIPVFSNVTGKKILSGTEAKKIACLHITSPVRWIEEEAAIAACGIDTCFEVGPGNVLSGLWKNSGSEIPVLAAGTAMEIEALGY